MIWEFSAKKDRTPFLNDVFGYLENEVYVKGLCDSDNEVEFRVMLDSFRPLWKDRETLLIEGTSILPCSGRQGALLDGIL